MWAGKSLVGAAIAGLVIAVAAAPANAAIRDTRPPTTPTNVRTTAVSQTTVTLAWNPSTDNVRVRNYAAWAPGASVVWVTAPQTTVTLTGLRPGTQYNFRVQAWDGFNWSFPGTTDATTMPDVAAPSTPTGLAVNSAPTASKALITWSNASDDFGPISYQVLVNGVPSPNVFDTRPAGSPIGPTTTVWVRQLEPATTYTLAVRAVDGGGNVSSASNAVTMITAPSTDSTAPTTPTLTSANGGGTGYCPEELWLRWTASTDDAEASTAIEYEVRVNGTINEVVPGAPGTITYTEQNGTNTVTIIAVDRAGNASATSNAIGVPVNFVGC